MIRLRGMTWNHERGIKPLQAAAEAFRQRRPEVVIDWDARSLQDFEQYPLELLANTYDLIMIDHPHLGTAVAEQLLVPLDGRLAEPYLEEQQAGSVGQSHASYHYAGHQWAVAADAAAQVSAYRPDLLQARELHVPQTWAEVGRLASALPEGQRIGLPLVPVHAFASLFTLCSQLSARSFWSDGSELDADVGEAALVLLQELLPLLHPQSLDVDPIVMSNLMSNTDEIAYVPLMYGYSNYARSGFAPHLVKYANIPSDDGEPRGSMIGGVGLAISSQSQHVEVAAEFVAMTASPAFQRTAFFLNGGQPGHRSAWLDPEVNRISNGFFADTLQTLDLGSMRPRFDGYIAFQEQAGSMIRKFLLAGNANRKQLIGQLNELLLASYK
ncbi:extracellular solute-binding protein [Paenibacillaceae bacterium]|nr:extracellular solute-binding protein [Paenibacillaceae bacterium]